LGKYTLNKCEKMEDRGKMRENGISRVKLK
jgi:hypothetical protein